MSRFIIEGGHPLQGSITPQGAKNEALEVISAVLLTAEPVRISNIPEILDVVDRQLEIMYDEISYQSSQSKIGIDEKGFKVFVAGTVNELVNRKMKQSVGK